MAAVQNVDRVLRLPGTLNIPDAKKRAKGRVPRVARLLHAGEQTYTPDVLSAAVPPIAAAERGDRSEEVRGVQRDLECGGLGTAAAFEDLEAGLRERFAAARERNPRLRRLWEGGDRDALLGDDASGSGFRFSLASYLHRAGGFTPREFGELLFVWDHAVAAGDDVEAKLTPRNIARDWVHSARASEADIVALWFEVPKEPLFPEEARASSEKTRTDGDVFELVSLGELMGRPKPRFVIERHIPDRSLGFLYGHPGSYKSFVALDWALHLAFGLRDCHGYATDADPAAYVVYLAGEGAQGLKARVSAWAARHGISDEALAAGRFRLIERSVNLMVEAEVRKLARTIRRGVGRACFVVVDTVSRSMPGAKENLQEDMTRFVGACDVVREEFGCVVLGVHHANRDGDMRGSTVLLGAGDFVFKLEKQRAGACKLICEKQKDAEDGWSDAYDLESVVSAEGASLVPVRRAKGAAADTTPAASGAAPPADLNARILNEIDAAWEAGKPWGATGRSGERHAVRRLMELGLSREAAKQKLSELQDAGLIAVRVRNNHNDLRGFRVLSRLSTPDLFE